MLTPEYLQMLADESVETAHKLHMSILQLIIERIIYKINHGKDYVLTAQDRWQIEVLQDAGYLLSDIKKEIVKRTPLMEKDVEKAFKNAAIKAITYDNEIYKAAGLLPAIFEDSPHLIRMMERGYKATMGTWENFVRTTADKAQQMFIKECDKAWSLVNSGAMSYSEAFGMSIEELAKNGIQTVTYSKADGSIKRIDTIETATLRAVRTGVSQTTAEITETRMNEMDWDIVLVSAHLGARCIGDIPENHEMWQGKFYSLNGKTPGYPLLKDGTGYGTGAGLCGWNCRHSFGPGDGVFNPYDNIDTEENRKMYELTQKQRAKERAIRNRKKELAAYKTAAENATDPEEKAKWKEKEANCRAKLRSQNEAYREFCSENGLKPQSDRLQVANSKYKPDNVDHLSAFVAVNYDNLPPPKYVETIDKERYMSYIEEQGEIIRNLDEEHAVIIDKITGDVYKAEGVAGNVSVKGIEMKDKLILHNHPSTNEIIAFGPDDFDAMRKSQNCEFFLVNRDYNYYAKPYANITETSYYDHYAGKTLTFESYFREVQDGVTEVQHLAMVGLKENGYVDYRREPYKRKG